jgi:hypothetical protein
MVDIAVSENFAQEMTTAGVSKLWVACGRIDDRPAFRILVEQDRDAGLENGFTNQVVHRRHLLDCHVR